MKKAETGKTAAPAPILVVLWKDGVSGRETMDGIHAELSARALDWNVHGLHCTPNLSSVHFDGLRAAARGTLSAEEVARIMAEAGPRYRGGCLPASIDDIPPEPATTRALLEPVLLAAPLAWRLAGDLTDPPDFWKAHDRAGLPCAPGAPVTVSMTLENRGFAPIAGRYRFRVEPAGAARIEGPKTLAFDLAPDGRAGWEAALVPTGKATSFRLVATCSAPDQPGADLRFELPLRGTRAKRT